ISFRVDKATRSSLDPTSWRRHCFSAASHRLDNTKLEFRYTTITKGGLLPLVLRSTNM
uniref:Uncharacterized protein n=1 Tax=Cucumis melo TaxID=3656 RepID=A0A9I9E537_CUCME